jgi:hypothetical protein
MGPRHKYMPGIHGESVSSRDGLRERVARITIEQCLEDDDNNLFPDEDGENVWRIF